MFPILEHISSDVKINWENKLKDCSRNLMLLLQDEYRQHLPKLHTDIGALYVRLTPFKTHEDYVECEKKLKEHLEEYGKSILLKKKINIGGIKCIW